MFFSISAVLLAYLPAQGELILHQKLQRRKSEKHKIKKKKKMKM